MPGIEHPQRRDHLFNPVANRAVAADDVGVDVRQPHLVPPGAPAVDQVEEDGAAADEGLDVARQMFVGSRDAGSEEADACRRPI